MKGGGERGSDEFPDESSLHPVFRTGEGEVGQARTSAESSNPIQEGGNLS